MNSENINRWQSNIGYVPQHIFLKDDSIASNIAFGVREEEWDLQKIKDGWTDVDVIITMPSIMGKLGPLGKILGPRGLMPNPKTGTVTMNVGKAVEEVKAGKIDFKVEKNGIVHVSIGKVSFDAEKIYENAKEVIQHIIKIKPSSSKGNYLKSISMSSTMSPGIKVDTNI